MRRLIVLVRPASRVEGVMVAHRVVRAAALGAVLVTALTGPTACASGQRTEERAGGNRAPSSAESSGQLPGHRVEVHLDGLRGSEGSRIAGVLFRGRQPADVRHTNAVGGFGVEVDEEPFSRVVAVQDRSPFGRGPFQEGRAADVGPGGYTLVIWRGRSLGPYTEWFPADEPGVTGCPVRIEVGDDAVTTVTVTGFPRQAEPMALETLRPCLQ